MTPARLHPFFLVILIPYLARTLGLLYYYFGSGPGGQAMVPAPLAGISVVLPHHLCAISALFATALGAWNLLPRLRAPVLVGTVLAAALVVVIGQVDLSMRRYLGHGLTLSTIHTYFDVNSVGDDSVLLSLKQDWAYVAASLAMMATFVLFTVAAAYRAFFSTTPQPVAWKMIAAPTLAWLVLACGGFPRAYSLPPEVSLFRSLAGQDNAPKPLYEGATCQLLRTFVDPPRGSVWLDDKFPLLRQEPASVSVADPPDIVLIVVESLRGQDVGFASGRSPSVTPNLDALAGQGVALPHYIANGFASASSFITLQSSTWTHRTRLISSECLDLTLDSFPLHLARLGYQTVLISGCNPEFEKLLTWAQRWYGTVDYIAGSESHYTPRMSDKAITDRSIEQLGRHDREHAKQPLMLSIFTAGMHQPYTLEDSPKQTAGIADPQLRYDLVLENWDAQLGRLLVALRARPRWNNTVVIVVGDHSHFTNDVLPDEVRAMPTDPTVWTSGLVFGPPALIGAPRRIEAVRSHVDLMPTILKLAGDKAPHSTLGHSLLENEQERLTIGVRGGGIRLDRGGVAVLFPHGKPEQLWVFKPFHRDPRFSHDLAGTTLTLQDLKTANEIVSYWSYLIENNRLAAPPRTFASGPLNESRAGFSR